MTDQLIAEPVLTGASPPQMTYEEYLALPSEGPLVEWVNGEVIYHMPPLTIHPRIAGFCYALLKAHVDLIGLGEVIVSPFEMKCRPDGNSREPDVLFVSTEHLGRITEKRLEGPADLVIEIVSDDSVARDLDEKFIEYQECGVQEYWIIDPRPRRKRALFYQRGEDGLFEGVKAEGGVYRSRAVPGFWLKVEWLWDQPDSFAAFAEVAGLSEQTLRELRERRTGMV